LPEEYRRIVQVVRTADGPVMAKDVCTALDLGVEPRQVERGARKLRRPAPPARLAAQDGDGRYTASL